MADDTSQLLALPEVVLTHVFSFLTYDEIAKNRVVCRQFNEIGWRLLNLGFAAAEKYQSASLKAVKTLLPRRESERRKHPLSKKCDILVAIETRLSMLSMAFNRFIETKLCCFIPGRVIDELFRVMRSLDSLKEPVPAHLILQELRDISTMAMEYFDDKIAPSLRKKEMSARGMNIFDTPPATITTSKIESCKFEYLKNSGLAKWKRKQLIAEQRIQELLRINRELRATLSDQSTRLSNNEAVTNDLKRQFDEMKKCINLKCPYVEPTANEASTSATEPNYAAGDDSADPVTKKRKIATKNDRNQ